MHWLTFTSTLFFTLLFSSVCEALPARLGPEDSTTSMYLPSPQVRQLQHAESPEISPVVHTKPTADIRSLYSLYLAMESHHSFPTPSPSPTLSPSRLVLHSILSPMPVSVAQTVSPIIASADDDDDGHPDGLGIATWLMASIFGLFLSVSVCGLLIRACGQRKPENNASGVHRILAKGGQEEEMKVIDITKECLYSRFSDCSSDAQTFAVDLGVDVGNLKRGDVRVSQVRVQPRARSVSGILRPFSLLPSRRLGHLRTNSAPERKHRGGVFSFGHAKAVKSVVLESGVGVGDVKVPVVVGDVV